MPLSDCASSPTSTNSAVFSRNVASDQKAVLCRRASARTVRGPTWPIASPHTPTASTPDASISSASRNAVNGITSITVLLSIGSEMRRRTMTPSHATRAPIMMPPP